MSKLTDEDKDILGALAKAIAIALGTKPAKGKAAEEDDDNGDDTDGDNGDDTDGDDADGDAFDADDDDAGEDDKPTRDNVRDALRAAAKALKSQDKAVALMKKVGGTDALSKLKEAKFAAVIAAANKAVKAAKAK